MGRGWFLYRAAGLRLVASISDSDVQVSGDENTQNMEKYVYQCKFTQRIVFCASFSPSIIWVIKSSRRGRAGRVARIEERCKQRFGKET